MPPDADRQEIIEHLSQPVASVSPKYLYDPLGSKLFEAITCLPEYYPSRIEHSLLTKYGEEISVRVGREGAIIDLGAGNGEKAVMLFPLVQPRQYLAVDFSVAFLSKACAQLRAAFPDIEVLALGADLTRDWTCPMELRAQPRLFFYPGSSIGNFHPEEALVLLKRISRLCAPGDGLLIGVDLLKDEVPLEAAYDDALGLTAAFNLNVLRHLNMLIDSDFDPQRWRHCASFNPVHGRMEMHLEALDEHVVLWGGGGRRFRAGERIHTENSYKYRWEAFQALLQRAGFMHMKCWTDELGWYALCYAWI